MARTTMRTCTLNSGANGDISLAGVEGSMRRSKERLGWKGWGQLMKERVGNGKELTIRPCYTPVSDAPQLFSHLVLEKGPQGGTA